MELGLYTNKADIWPEDIRQLIQSVVYLAESIYIPATVRVSPILSAKDRAYIHEKLMDLHSLGALRFWEVEGVKSFLAADSGTLNLRADHVISRAEYNALYEKVIERLMANRTHFLKSEAQVSVEGIAEIVRGKHVLWSFALKDFFGVNDIVLDAANASNSKLFFDNLLKPSLVDASQEVIEEVSMRLHIPDVSQLTMSQIETCRTLMPAFRDNLLAEIKAGGSLEFDRKKVLKKTADEIVDRFVDYILEKKFTSGDLDSMPSTWTLNQLLFSREVKDNGDRFFRWEGQNDAPAPELLLWKLKSDLS